MSSTPAPIRIATRGSSLALAQAHHVLAECRAALPGQPFEIRIIKTTGDRLQKASMARVDPKLPKGLFTKELEAALLRDEADFAVHSLKDLPTELPRGLRLAAVLPREDPRDVLVMRAAATDSGTRSKSQSQSRSRARRDSVPAATSLATLPLKAVVATSSTRRAAQLLAQRPDLQLVEIRGNVPTRLQKLAANRDLDATILARAGLVRLGIHWDSAGILVCPESLAALAWSGPLAAHELSLDEMLPAVGQAAIGLECRSGDRRTAGILQHLNHAATLAAVRAERAFLSGFGGGCHSPVAALATVARGRLHLRTLAFEGNLYWHEEARAPIGDSLELGRRLGRAARQALFAGRGR